MGDNKSFIDEFNEKKPESFNEEVFVENKRNYVPLIIGTALMLIVVGVILMLTVFKKIEVPDMAGWKAVEVYEWCDNNKVVLVSDTEYDLEVAKDMLISQTLKAGEKIQRGDSFEALFSLGTDPNELVKVPNIESLTYDELKDWVSDNKLSGVNFKKSESDKIEKDNVISYKIVDGDEDEFKRKSRINITISTGPQKISDYISVPDFSAYSKASITNWGTDNGVEIEIEEVHHDSILAGDLISQSVSKDKEIERSEKIKVVLSLGKVIKVPSFVGLAKEEALELATIYGLRIFTHKINSTQDAGIVLSQDTSVGEEVKENQLITLNVSKGNISAPDFVNLTKAQAVVLAELEEVQLVFYEVETTEYEDGQIIEQNVTPGKLIDLGDKILLQVVVNTAMEVVDFNGKKKYEAERWAEINDVEIIYLESYSDEYSVNTLYNQNITEGLLQPEDVLTMNVSLGRVTIADFVGQTRLDMINWQTEVNDKGANVQLRYEFIKDTNKKKGVIISQSTKHQLISIDEVITVGVSDTDDGIVIPRLMTYSESDFIDWCEVNEIPYTIKEAYSDIYKKEQLFDQKTVNRSLDEGEKLVIYKSLGQVKITDFRGQSKLDIMDWQTDVNNKGAKIELMFQEIKTSDAPRGTVESLSVVNEFIKLNTTVVVGISIGDTGTYIPDLTSFNKADLIKWCDSNGIKYKFKELYSDTYPKSYLFGQNYTQSVLPKDEELVIYISLGKVVIEDYVGLLKQDIVNWQNEINRKGAYLTIKFIYKEDKSVTKDTILEQTNTFDVMNTNSTITVTLAK